MTTVLAPAQAQNAKPDRLISVSFGPPSAEHQAWLAQIQEHVQQQAEKAPSPQPHPIQQAA